MKTNQEQMVDRLNAISPLDGRYGKETADFLQYFSEAALIKNRFNIEAKYLIALSDVGAIRTLTEQEKEYLNSMGQNLSDDELVRVKQIEGATNHDVVAMSSAFKEIVGDKTLSNLTELIHLGLTSEDINNLSYRLMIKNAIDKVYIPKCFTLEDKLIEKIEETRDVKILARTHGQPALGSKMGKELAYYATRLHKQIIKLQEVKLTGKLNGAIGNYNALNLILPDIDWIEFSKKFVTSLDLEPNLITTQINPHEDIIEASQVIYRINGIVKDLDQNMWRYISDDWLGQKKVEGERGSSTMTGKVNPIQFENSEGNTEISDGFIEKISEKLRTSRLQRDLSDSTVMRNYGQIIAYSHLAINSTIEGLDRVFTNDEKMIEALNSNWQILGEAAQTILRFNGFKNAYDEIVKVTRGTTLNKENWHKIVNGLDANEEVKQKILSLTPENYIGLVDKLTDIALEEIKSRKN